MKLSKRVIFLLVAGLAVIIAVSGTYFYFSFNSFLMDHEENSIQSDLDHFFREINMNQQKLILIANDWVKRDNTNRVIDPLNMNFYIQYSINTEFTQDVYVDSSTGETINFPENFKLDLIENIAKNEHFEDFSSIYYFDESYYYISSIKVNDLSITAQKDLVIIMGKEIDSFEMETLSKIVGGDISFTTNNGNILADNILFDFNENVIVSGTLRNEYNDSFVPTIGFQIIKERTFFEQGRIHLASILIFYFISLFILGAFAVLLINKIIFKPLFYTAKQISEYNVSDFSDKPVALGKYDEISSLKRAINEMVEKINQQHAKVQKSEHLFRTIFEQAPMGIALSDSKNFKMKNLNKKFRQILGIDNSNISEDSGLEIDWRKITHPDDIDEDASNMQKLIDGEINSYSMNKRYILENGEIVWVSMRVAKINSDDKDYPLAICMVNDITNYKKNEEEIHRLTFKDVLTGLYNRTYFEKIKKELINSNSYPLSVIMCDINRLKVTNDGFGHHYGDKLLILASEIIKKSCNPYDLIFRIGGDEFCILLPNVTSKKAEQIRKKIEYECNEYLNNSGDILYISVALGTSTTSNPQKDLEELIKEAEDLMQKHKIDTRDETQMRFTNHLSQVLLDKKIESKDKLNRLSEMAHKLKDVYSLSTNEQENLKLLASIHNIGKICSSEIKKHPDSGYRIASVINEFSCIAKLILTHHEQYDGKGYPQGLKEKQIPKLSRIFALMDSFDDLTHDRPNRRALSKQKAIEEIKSNLGRQFDPEIAQKFIEFINSNY